MHQCGSALAFPFGEGGPLAVEEVLPQYEFAAGFPEFSSAYRTSPAPFGGTLPRGEGPDLPVKLQPETLDTNNRPLPEAVGGASAIYYSAEII